LPKLDTTLNVLLERWQRSGASALEEAGAGGMAVEGERILVTLIMRDDASTKDAIAALPELGAEVTSHYSTWIVALVPMDQLAAVSLLPGVSIVKRPTPAPAPLPPDDKEGTSAQLDPVTGQYITQGVARANADSWHAAGLTGNGIEIGIIDSFNAQVLDEAYNRGEVPTNVFYGENVPVPGGMHGVAVAEIIHDMAPDANLTLVVPDAVVGPNQDACENMASIIEDLAQAGHDIISSSWGAGQCGAGDGTGNPVAVAASNALNTYDTIFIQAAGNEAKHHYEGYYSDHGSWHNFEPGFDSPVNPLIIYDEFGEPYYYPVPQGALLRFWLRWNGGWPGSSQDYDLYLVFWNGSEWQTLVGLCYPFPCYSANTQNGVQPPTEEIVAFAPYEGYYAVAIYKTSADGTHFLDMSGFHANAPALLYSDADRSLIAPASSAYAFSVAAVDVNSLELEGYSSWGPTYGPGNEPSGGYPQPQISGFANVDTWTYLTLPQTPTPFSGTSAATPHISGAAALVKGANPCLSAFQIGDFLKDRSMDRGAPGFDSQYGRGVLDLGEPTNTLCLDFDHSLYLPLIVR
jgi:hypothetical protein